MNIFLLASVGAILEASRVTGFLGGSLVKRRLAIVVAVVVTSLEVPLVGCLLRLGSIFSIFRGLLSEILVCFGTSWRSQGN